MRAATLRLGVLRLLDRQHVLVRVGETVHRHALRQFRELSFCFLLRPLLVAAAEEPDDDEAAHDVRAVQDLRVIRGTVLIEQLLHFLVDLSAKFLHLLEFKDVTFGALRLQLLEDALELAVAQVAFMLMLNFLDREPMVDLLTCLAAVIRVFIWRLMCRSLLLRKRVWVSISQTVRTEDVRSERLSQVGDSVILVEVVLEQDP